MWFDSWSAVLRIALVGAASYVALVLLLRLGGKRVLAKLNAYRAEGIDAFILSGYPHAAEADLFARHVLPRIEHGPLVV